MNLKALHKTEKEVSAIPLFKGQIGTTIAIQLAANGKLKEHITKTPALLLCIKGSVVYGDENNLKFTLSPGDYIEIEPMVKHWHEGTELAELVLIK